MSMFWCRADAIKKVESPFDLTLAVLSLLLRRVCYDEVLRWKAEPTHQFIRLIVNSPVFLAVSSEAGLWAGQTQFTF